MGRKVATPGQTNSMGGSRVRLAVEVGCAYATVGEASWMITPFTNLVA